MPAVYLLMAIAAEVVATSTLKATHGFTRLLPTVVVIVGYTVAFIALSRSLAGIPVGVAYATWAGVGTASITLLSWVLYAEALSAPALCGIALIIVGVGLVNLYSQVH